MALLTDDFNSYANGNLSGQGSWTGDTNPQVEGTTVVEGAKAVSATLADTNDWTITKTGSVTVAGTYVIYFQANNTNFDWFRTGIYYDIHDLGIIKITGTTVYYTDASGSYQTLSNNFTANVWHYLSMQWLGDNTIRYQFDNEGWTSYMNQHYSAQDPDIVNIEFIGNGGAVTQYIDYIAENPYAVSQIKKLTGVAQSSLKKISGVVIASVKKVAGVSNV